MPEVRILSSLAVAIGMSGGFEIGISGGFYRNTQGYDRLANEAKNENLPPHVRDFLVKIV